VPNCYDCKYRRNLPGDCHSKCAHPTVENENDDPLKNLMAIFASVGRVAPQISTAARDLGIKAKAHGVKNGWFNWPWNYDPIWLEACNGFEAKESK